MSNETQDNNTMYDSIVSNEQITNIYDNVVGELETQALEPTQITSALLAATSMGFNDLFNILSRMIVNADILNTYMTDKDVEDNLSTIAVDTIRIITGVGKSINNDDIKSLTERLNIIMAAEAEANESTTDSEIVQDEPADLS